METPQTAVQQLYDAGLTRRDIVALLTAQGVEVADTTIMRIGAGEVDPRYTTGNAIIRLARKNAKRRG